MGKPAKTTTSASVPSWLSTPLQGLTGQITAAGQVDPMSRIAGSNQYLDAAGSSLMGGLNPQISKMLEGAGSAASVGATGASDYYDKYKNPWENDVINTSLADFDVGAGRQTAQADLDMAGADAFNGSGSALTKSMLGGEIARGRGALSAGLRSQGFNTAMGLGSQDADRFLQAGIANAGFQDAAAGRNLQAAGLLGNLENQLLGQRFAFGDYERERENERLNADYSNLAKQSALYSPLGSLFKTVTETKKPGTLDYIASGAGLASMFFGG
jgi:hypothetical protein